MVSKKEQELIKEIRDFTRNFKNEEARRALEKDNFTGYKQFLADLGSARLFNNLTREKHGDIDRAHAIVYRLEKMIKEWETIIKETQKIENNLNYRKEVKGKLIEENANLLSKINNLTQITSLENKLDKLEKTFDQQIRVQKNDWNNQIKTKRNQITNVLHSGKGSSTHLHKEIEDLKKNLSDYEKLVQQLQEARNILTDSEDIKNLAEHQNYLTISIQELQKGDDDEVCKGVYQSLEKVEEKQEEIKKVCEKIENSIGKRITDLNKRVSVAQKLTQKLLGDQQLESHIEITSSK